MKKLLIILIIVPGIVTLNAQGKRTCGIIKYKDIVKMDLKIEGDASRFSEMLPKEMESEKELLFNEKAMLYKNSEKEVNANEAMGNEDVMIHISMDSPDYQLYTDLEKGVTIEKREFMTRKFLITGGQQTQEWKITPNQKIILEMPCQEARTMIDSAVVSAWFSPSIPVPGGPGSFNGLPGLILEVNIDNGNHRIFAQSVELQEIPDDLLEKPRKGKEVTKEEFDRIVAEKVKEQGGQVEGGKVMMIEIRQ